LGHKFGTQFGEKFSISGPVTFDSTWRAVTLILDVSFGTGVSSGIKEGCPYNMCSEESESNLSHKTCLQERGGTALEGVLGDSRN